MEQKNIRNTALTLLICGVLAVTLLPKVLAFALSPHASKTDKIEAILCMPGVVIPAMAMNQLRIDYQKGDF